MRFIRMNGAAFAAGFAVATILTAVATGFAITGVGAGPASPQLFLMLLASLAIALALGVALALQLVKLARSRRTPQTGARLQLRFVALFSVAAVIPAILVAIFLTTIMSRGVDEWFSQRVRTTVDNAALVGASYVDAAKERISGEMEAMAIDLNYAVLGLKSDPKRYQEFLLKQSIARSFDAAYVVEQNGRVLASAQAREDRGFRPPTPADFSEAGLGAPTLTTFEETGVIRGLLKLEAYDGAYLYIARSEPLLRQLRVFADSVDEYRQAKERQTRLRTLFGLAYLDTTLLVLLGAIWLGLSNASRVSEPIGRLADAAGRVANGELSARVAVGLERDEVDALGSAFNRMTAQLEAQRTDLVDAHRDAEERGRFISTVVANVSAGVVGLDPAGRVTAVNGSAARLLGVETSALDGRRLTDVAPEFGELIRAAQESADQGSTRIDLARAGGTVHLSVRASRVESGEGVVLTFDDMTKLFAAQRQEAWKDVARRIAHEIKNPLTPIQLSAERLRRKYRNEIQSDQETFDRCTDTILRQVADIGRMVDEFSGFARMPAPRMERVDFAEIARESAFSQRLCYTDIRFDVEGDEHPLTIDCDGRLMAQALTNILKNAAEAIGARRAADGEPKEGHVLLKLERRESELTVSVLDNGVGLPGHNRDRLVEPYVTTRAKGTGLGLAIVKRVVEDHGGTLALADSPLPGPGAMICITLPLAMDGAQRSATATAL